MRIATRDRHSQLKTAEDAIYYYPNNIGRIILLAMEDILGRHGVNALLNLSGNGEFVNKYPPSNLELAIPFESISRLLESLDELFGSRAGRTIAIHAGRETFRRGLKELGPILGISDLALRALPLGIKIKIGLNVFAETMNRFTDQVVRLDEEPQHYYWIIERCPFCWGRSMAEPGCHLATGILHEAAEWVSNGRQFEISQSASVACGDEACVFVVNKRPLRK